jgi:hypothetical protein
MKKATCKQLAGACEEIITGNTPEEMAENSKKHAMENINDPAHQKAMQDMMNMSEEAQQTWYQSFVDSFNSLEDV